MAEVTHEQIFRELGSVKERVARIEERSDQALEGVQANQDHIDSEFGDMRKAVGQLDTRLASFEGKINFIAWFFPVLVATVSAVAAVWQVFKPVVVP